MEQVFDLFPILKEKRRQPAGELVRRPAPAGGRWPRADDQAESADAGRTDSRRVSHRDGRAVRPHHRDRPYRHRHPDGRAERPQALDIADKGYVLVQGENRYTDTGAKLLADPEVRRAFLGG
jgi:branched-chain amino acid transport system ATP-binding protein